jgi:hypothetical protein
MSGRATTRSAYARSLLLSRGPGATGVLVELGVVAVALAANLTVRWLTLDDVGVAVSHAHDVLALEQAWHLDWEHAAQDAVRSQPWLGTIGAWFYVWGYLPVVVLALVVLFVLRPADYARLRNALLSGGVVGLAVYLLYPLAPPRLTDLGYADPVASSVVEASARPVGIANEIAAMPSFHVGYLVVVAVVVWRLTDSTLLRAWCVLHPLLMCWVVVATGNHWVLDLPAGVAIALLGLWVADRIARTGDARVADG